MAANTRGIDQVVKNLDIKIKAAEVVTPRGLKRAALLVIGDAKPRCPVVTGNLKGSGYTRSVNVGGNPGEVLGFTAAYALYVHENPSAGNSGQPGASTVGEPKYLETALKVNQREMLDMIAEEARRAMQGK